MDPEQSDPGFIVFASMKKNNLEVHLNIFSICKKQTTFSGQNKIVTG